MPHPFHAHGNGSFRPGAIRLALTRLLLVGAMLALVAVAWGSDPATGSLDDYVRRFESSYHATRTLRADFTQTYVWGERTRVESGTVYFARGGLMRWDYRQPSEKLFLSDGKHLLLYIPAEKQLTRSALKSSEDFRAPFRLLLSRVNLHKVFAKIEFADSSTPRDLPGTRDPADKVLRAVPKLADDAGYREVLIEVTPQFDVRRLVMDYPDRSRMEFTFDRIVRDSPLSADLFRFKASPGTEIIDQ